MGAFPISLPAYVAGMQGYNASGNVHTPKFGEKLKRPASLGLFWANP